MASVLYDLNVTLALKPCSKIGRSRNQAALLSHDDLWRLMCSGKSHDQITDKVRHVKRTDIWSVSTRVAWIASSEYMSRRKLIPKCRSQK